MGPFEILLFQLSHARLFGGLLRIGCSLFCFLWPAKSEVRSIDAGRRRCGDEKEKKPRKKAGEKRKQKDTRDERQITLLLRYFALTKDPGFFSFLLSFSFGDPIFTP